MSEKKPDDDVIFSSKTISESYKGKEVNFEFKLKPPAKKPGKSVWDSIWVWFFLFLGINFIAGDPTGFTKTGTPQQFCQPDNSPKSEGHKPSPHDDNGECWY